ncbi:MAG: acyl-CoA carboxylase subunit beta [Lachnospiraceae bacterium]|nr:acyl-CoA carboxylase subunit beta [Lachnospiraceae bacterium]
MLWKDAIDELERRRGLAKQGGGEKRIERQHKKGKMTARERIDYIFDKGTFVEVNDLIESRIDDFNLKEKRVPGDGVVTGYGKIRGRLVFIASEDFTVIGGTLGEYHAKKICKIQDMAYMVKAPIIFMYDSGGARIEEGISSLSGYSAMFLRHTKASGVIPQISLMMGPCSGGACYSPALCDFVFMVEKTSTMFLTGPKVVKAVTSEQVTMEELGGDQIHTKISGVAHFSCPDEKSCMDQACDLLEYLPDNSKPMEGMEETPATGGVLKRFVRSNKNPLKDIEALVPDNTKKAYDVKPIIEALVDENSFFEVHAEFAKNAVVGFARMKGKSVGIIANQPLVLSGSLDYNASDKIARFIRFCDCFEIPLITLIDVPAFFPGTDQEQKGIIRHGAKILYAYAEATVPKISLIMRKAYGGAYIAMNSKDMGADMVFAWPIAEIAVMGADGAVNIIFKDSLKSAEDQKTLQQQLKAEYDEQFMNPYIAAARGYVDEVIRPDETRDRLLAALDMLQNKEVEVVYKKHGNIPL